MEQLLYADETYAIRGAIFEVYREMGSGFLESVYQECLEKEFIRRNIPYVAKCQLTLTYKGDLLIQTYEPDFVCYEKIIVELKAVKELAPDHEAQLINYLKATGLRLGLLANFASHPEVQIERRIIESLILFRVVRCIRWLKALSPSPINSFPCRSVCSVVKSIVPLPVSKSVVNPTRPAIIDARGRTANAAPSSQASVAVSAAGALTPAY